MINNLSKKQIILFIFIFASFSITIGASFFKAKYDVENYLNKTFFSNFKKDTGNLFYSSSTSLPIKGTLIDKGEDLWTIQANNSGSVKIHINSDVTFLETTSDYKNIQTWKVIDSNMFSKGDTVIVNIFLNKNDDQLYATTARRITQ